MSVQLDDLPSWPTFVVYQLHFCTLFSNTKVVLLWSGGTSDGTDKTATRQDDQL